MASCRGCRKFKHCKKQVWFNNEKCMYFEPKVKSITKQLDELWSDIVRNRSRNPEGKICCERCGSTNVVQAHHIIPRTQYGTRWELLNGVALCRKCHLYWAHKDAIGFYEWISRSRDIEELQMKKHNKPDKQMLLIYLAKTLRNEIWNQQ